MDLIFIAASVAVIALALLGRRGTVEGSAAIGGEGDDDGGSGFGGGGD